MASFVASITRHPVFHLGMLYTVLGSLIVYIPPQRQIERLVGLFTLVGLAYVSYTTVDKELVPIRTINWYVLTVVAVLLYANHWLCITKRSPPSSARTTAQKAEWVIRELLSNPRGEITRQKAWLRENPSYVPSCTTFVIYHAVRVALFFGGMKAFQNLDYRVYWENLIEGDYNEEKESIFRRLHEAELREYVIRSWLPFQYFIPTYCALSGTYSVLALIGVVVFRDDWTRWRPLFGDIRDVNTLRRFWNQWWQQYHRTAFISHGKLFAQTWLQLKNPTLVRLTIVLVVFFMSGAMHGVSIKLHGRACDSWPVVSWFMCVGVACVLEECFLLKWRASGLQARVPNYLQQVVGRLWVYMYFWWSLPKLMFPNIGCTIVDFDEL